jgi:hypothetical protein
VSSIPDANTVFGGQERKNRTEKDERTDRERRDTEIKTLKRDHQTDNRRDQRTAPRHDTRGS